MTERIDLDELDAAEDENEPRANYGDWLWRDDGDADPDAEPDPPGRSARADDRTRSRSDPGDEDESESIDDEAGGGSNASGDPASAPAPHVPKTGNRTPAGIPVDGSDGGNATTASPASDDQSNTAQSTPRPMGADASGPHGDGADDMTMAFTYGAARRLEHPERVFAGSAWADWIGIVGDVPVHVIGKFQRERGIDADFFNGTGTDPGERLAQIDRNSMFYADRTVVVGCEGADEPIAEAAGWEFVPLSKAAAKAGWSLAADDESAPSPSESDPEPE
ncbi:DUF7124 domain-containing protein [Halosolutus gelatinilyticus]|uniref:DUF7124 domain-containing protein n=1 Tax=Halosolutus gelatinilyticus TaxID=2931975 RepID=UPI001FF547E6|nr:hypothetical protein [Halosolutus gelatinilyticus]